MRRALVTGASKGLGRAIAVLLAGRGLEVVAVDREAGDPSVPGPGIACDLADRAELDRTLPAILAAGPYDAAILNAGVSATGRFEAIPVEAYRRLMTVNAETPMLLCAALVRERALRGPLCLVASLSHFTGYPGAAVYAASKDALAAYAASVRKPFAREGVTVTLACPGPLRTDHAERHAPPGADPSRRMVPEVAARIILDATLAGRRLVVPGRAARLAALAGALFPHAAARRMRELVFEKLDREVW